MKKCLVVLCISAMAALFALPVLVTLTSSFMGAAELSEVYEKSTEVLIRVIPKMVTLNGYYNLLFASGTYLSMFWNSVLLAVAIAAGSVLAGLVMGYVLAKVRFRGRDKLRFAYIVVMMMPFQVTLLPNYIVLKQMGLYNTNWALILPGIFSPFGVFLLNQFIRSMPDEVVEAATLETASPLRVLSQIVAPMVYPAILALFLLSFADAWNMVEQPLILLQDRWRYPLSLALNDIRSAEPTVAFAGSVLYMLPIVLLYWLFHEELTQGLRITKF